MLPEVKARLPGNHAACRFLNLGAAAEAKIAQAIQLDEGGGYLQMEPSETQALLAQARELIEAHPGSAEIALVVKNAAIRRFARKVIELEFPHLSVLSREELMPGLEANFLDHVRAALAD
jgi:type III secretory pathway component EscV